MTQNDFYIYYSSMAGTHHIDCRCSRWDVNDYSVIFETWLTKSQLQTLRENITPNAVGELYQILGKPLYYDQTWVGQNTIRLVPTGSTSNLENMRSERLLYVKNISDSPIESDSGWLAVKIECMISGSGGL